MSLTPVLFCPCMRGFSGESKLYEEEDAVGEHRLEALGLLVMDVFRGRIERRRDALWMCYYKLLGIQELTTV